MIVLAIDAGTTGNRVIAFDEEARIVAQAYHEFPQIRPQPGWVEQDANTIWQTTKQALDTVLAQVGAENVACIGITNQRETTILWDRKTGEPVHNAIVWQCRRTTDYCAELKADAEFAKRVQAKTGLFLDPYFSATKLRWLLDNVDGLAGRDLCFGTVDSWLLWKLTGGNCHATDASNASRTLLCNIHTGDWDDELLSHFGVPRSVLPQIVDSEGLVANSAASVTGRAIPITGILGDQQAAFFGQGGWQEGVVKQTYGTGLFMMALSSERPEGECLGGGLLETIAWQRGGQRTLAVEGSVFIGGACIQWLRDGLGIIEKASETEALARALDDNEGVYLVPALNGLGAPWWDPTARGLIIGCTQGTDRRHIARAALESLAYQTRDLVEAMREAAAISPDTMRVDGGACANDFLMQFQADILGIQIERPAVLESTALGAAAIAGFAAGVWDEPTFLAARQIDRCFQPSMAEDQRAPLYSRWREAVQRSLAWD
ncbi:MAG: glycerol kinase [Rhodothermales bacterium]|jgi:glycerol kinase